MVGRFSAGIMVGAALLLGGIAKAEDRELLGAISLPATDWPWWRGPQRNGIANSDQKPPLKWSETEGVLWKASIPGRGHGSPTVVGDRVFLATAEHDREVQSVICFDRNTGKVLWQTEVHKGGFDTKGNAKSSLASSTLLWLAASISITSREPDPSLESSIQEAHLPQGVSVGPSAQFKHLARILAEVVLPHPRGPLNR